MFKLVFGRLTLGLLLCATGALAFTASTSTPTVKVKENEGADLKCSHSADFGADARVEWKFQDAKATQTSLVIYDGQATANFAGRVTQYSGGLRFNKVTRKDTGLYICSVAGNGYSADAKITLTVLVAPSKPMCRIPASVKMGTNVKLTCSDSQASPPPTYSWYKNNAPLPQDPSKFPDYRNMTYKLNPATGTLVFPRVSQIDQGEYFCESTNTAGPPQRSVATKMAVYGVNTGGIVAGVIILLILIVLLIVGLWFAHRKGYLTSEFCVCVCVCFSVVRPSQRLPHKGEGESVWKQQQQTAELCSVPAHVRLRGRRRGGV
ncbi:junctional adhesion molecule A-like isoform X2 [Sardina pilchardus]|uniref:junctional adhesion molecule A-like isoform X2 n=1 Tax=Sardina pilchardus TaxID=27697 RepID=UPI002E142E26